ncbi:DUF2071 domain-containing protein [Nocardia sp. NPDC052566]|uniref:DUF2071 domain-containing protein n=1 Tax=Nocardia sp. NPDC052566 TaxID=3364330 RepID=UPI0037CB1CDF
MPQLISVIERQFSNVIERQLSSVIERRLLVNYRVDPEFAARLLPFPLRPQLVRDWAVAGICLLRLGQLRPVGMPAALGVRSENAASRVAVEWDGPRGVETGVYLARRDTGSPLNALLGGRFFPGVHNLAHFDVDESETNLHVAYASRDGTTRAGVDAHVLEEFEGSVLFPDFAAASDFFRHGSTGFSESRDGHHLNGLELYIHKWQVSPVHVDSIYSTFFGDQTRFPPGTATLDCALLMRDLTATWSPAGFLHETAVC